MLTMFLYLDLQMTINDEDQQRLPVVQIALLVV